MSTSTPSLHTQGELNENQRGVHMAGNRTPNAHLVEAVIEMAMPICAMVCPVMTYGGIAAVGAVSILIEVRNSLRASSFVR